MPQTQFRCRLFVRDDDEIIRHDIGWTTCRAGCPTESDYEKDVTLQIDGCR
jgi:hypothetical protein